MTQQQLIRKVNDLHVAVLLLQARLDQLQQPNAAKVEQDTALPDKIITATAMRFNLDVTLLKARKKPEFIAKPRMFAMYLMKELTDLEWHDIAFKFRKHHTTAIYAHKVISNELALYPYTRNVVTEIMTMLQYGEAEIKKVLR